MKDTHRLITGVIVAATLVFGCSRRSTGPISLEIAGRPNATPSIAAHGSIVAVAWGAGAAPRIDVVVAVSRDGGVSFGRPVQVNTVAGEARLGGELPPRVALTSVEGSSLPRLTVVWTARGEVTEIKAATSHDLGVSFDAPITLHTPAPPGDRGWPALATTADGGVHAVWLDHRGVPPRQPQNSSGHQHQAGAPYDGVAMAQHSALYYASANAPAGSERAVARGVCYCCKTALASAPDGTLYAAWRHVYEGNMRDIAFAALRPGETFSEPVRVHEDGWSINGCPDNGPALAVDKKGVVHLVWPTVVNGTTPEAALFYASSADGRAFTRPVRIPTAGRQPSHPQIAAGPDGRMIVAWDESAAGGRVAVAREINVAGGSPVFGQPVLLGSGGVYPAIAVSAGAVVAVWTTQDSPSRVLARVVPMLD